MSHPHSLPVTGPATPVAIPAISLATTLPWLIFAALLMLVAMYFVSAEQGATSLLSGAGVHEWVHDGRHLLGFPCH
ncbi:MAG: CbtB domain-containing protein [Propionibacteriaceae bacterium]